MRTGLLIAALAVLLWGVVSSSDRTPATGPAIDPIEVSAAAPDARSEVVAPIAARDVRAWTAAPRAGDTDRLTAAWQRRRHHPPDLVRVPGTGTPSGQGPLRRYAVEVEAATGIDPDAFAATVDAILADPRSWTAGGGYTLQRVDRGRLDLRVTLATPDTVDALCWPLDTRGMQSCWNEDRAVINAFRWEHGAETYAQDLDGYRAYLVNHEVGHGLGKGHVVCPARGDLAPVMLQQTITLGGCAPNPWPFPRAAVTPPHGPLGPP